MLAKSEAREEELKRQLSLETQAKTIQGDSKSVRLDGLVEEPIEIDNNSQVKKGLRR